MKALTTFEVRCAVAKLPVDLQKQVNLLLFSACDEGLSLGLANAPRADNPYLAAAFPEQPEPPKTKAR